MGAKAFWRCQRANVGFIFALMSAPILAAVGAAIDAGRGSYQKTRLQSAPDAAVLAGAVAAKKELERGGSRREALAKARSTARSLLQSNFGDG